MGAIDALSYWSDRQLKDFGDDLVLRSVQDAQAIQLTSQVVDKINSLSDLDDPQVLANLKAIADNSVMSVGSNNRVVIGLWKDDLHGGYAREGLTGGGTIYYTNPEVSKIINGINDEELRNTIYTKLNELALEPYIDNKMLFQLTFSGFSTDETIAAKKAISEIAKGNIDIAKVTLENADVKYSSMFKEVERLVGSGYSYYVDTTGLISFVK